MNFDLPLGIPGLTLPDIRLRVYAGAERVPVAPGEVTLAPTASSTSDYVLNGLPEEGRYRYTATFEAPEGVGHSRVWFDGRPGPTSPPEVVIVPLRLAGQAGVLDLLLLRNGSEPAVSLTVDELGDAGEGEPGDYAVAGWPLAEAGERWSLRWQVGGVYFATTWSVPAAEGGLAPETIVRRLVGRYWLEEWLGPALDERRYCPARVLGFVGQETSFSVEDAADVAPWTPAEVRTAVGYALMRLREVDRFDDGLTAGEEGASIVSGEYVLYALDFELAVPSKLRGEDPVKALEDRLYAVERLFQGLALYPPEGAVLSVRNLARYPTRRRGGTDDGTWRRAFLTVQVRARVRRSHVGAKEVELP